MKEIVTKSKEAMKRRIPSSIAAANTSEDPSKTDTTTPCVTEKEIDNVFGLEDELNDHEGLKMPKVNIDLKDLQTSPEAIVKFFKTLDEKVGMTYGRMIARFFSRYKWYYPQHHLAADSEPSETDHLISIGTGDVLSTYTSDNIAAEDLLKINRKHKNEQPDLDAAWSFFEHFTLPRRYVDDDGREIRSAVYCIRADAGECSRPTKLYNPFSMTLNEFGDFGIGIGLYFSTLRALSVILFITALIHIPNFIYFSSNDYSSNSQISVPMILRGSAICTVTKWVPCPECVPDDDNSALIELWATSRVIPVRAQDTKSFLYFVLKNECGDRTDVLKLGLVSLIGSIFLVVALLLLGEAQRRLQVRFDERNATATDFSVVIGNPPSDAVDANEWKEFLEVVASNQICKCPHGLGGGVANVTPLNNHVTSVTIALNNQDLIASLVKKRALQKKAKKLLSKNDSKSFDDYYQDARLARAKNALMKPKKLRHVMNLLIDLNEQITFLESKRYEAVKVIAIFETEIGQRAALTALSLGQIHVIRQNTKAVKDKRNLFRGSVVVNAHETSEPMTIRWGDLGVPRSKKIAKFIYSSAFSILAVYLCFHLVRLIWVTKGAKKYAISVAVLNLLIPRACRLITFFEYHNVEGSKQASLNFKATVFRCINSAVLLHLVTAFPRTLVNDGLIQGVCAIFIADMVTAPTLQTLNIPDNFKRHFIAPRMKTQHKMNRCFTGGRWELAERYTSMTKIVFMCFFFSAIYPAAFFLATLALLVQFEVDRFCLLRVWARAPMLGPHTTRLNRTLLVPLLLITLTAMNAYSWSGYPYDNICESHTTATGSYLGTHSLVVKGDRVSISITEEDEVYHSCSQDFLDRFPLVFPALPSFQQEEWMTFSQEDIVSLHAWTCVVVICISSVYIFFFSDLADVIKDFFLATYKPNRQIYGTNFSDVPGVIFPAYVPQLVVPGRTHPMITCDISAVDHRHVGWIDPDCLDYSDHNLSNDVSLEARNKPDKPIFSIVKQWKPPNTAENQALA